MGRSRPAPCKPWDVGDGRLRAAVSSVGRVISVHGPHPRWGWMYLGAFPPFDESARYNPPAVRAYRRGLEDPGLPGLSVKVDGLKLFERRWKEGAIPELIYLGPGLEGRLVVFAAEGRLHVWMSLRALGPHAPDRVRARFDLSWGLLRAAYAQVTEGGPLPAIDPVNRLRWSRGALVWEAPGLPAWAALWPVPRAEEMQGPAPLRLEWEEEWDLPAGRVDRILLVELSERPPELPRPVCGAAEVEEALSALLRDRRWAAPLPRNPRVRAFVHRQLLFVLDACAVPVGDATCLVTDPVLLPLSWNRDAYFMACLLGAAGRLGGPLAERARRTILGHLRWLFCVAARPSGWWGRSHLTGGAVKDAAFQLDQQWYPVLEVARAAVDWGLPQAWHRYGPDALQVARRLVQEKHPNGLWPTSETPADDPLSLPYHFSSHVLAWRTLQLLSRLDPAGPWAQEAAALQATVRAAFTTPEGLFAYATDGERHRQYHDANDLPLACAARWGFCSAEDPTWRRTVAFAWTPSNPGFFPGPYGGLGSLHAPGPWTLGDVQAWLVGASSGDPARVSRAWRRLRTVAFDDGLLCESYDPQTGQPRTRAWFAWPGAAAAALVLGDSL